MAALAAADAMVKAANVTITDRQQVGDGLVAVIVTGEVVRSRPSPRPAPKPPAGGELVSVHVIPRPHGELGAHFSVTSK